MTLEARLKNPTQPGNSLDNKIQEAGFFGRVSRYVKGIAYATVIGLALAGEIDLAKASFKSSEYNIVRLSVPPVTQEYSYSYPYSINDKGEVVGTFGEGTSRPEPTSRRSFLYKDGNMIDTSLDDDCEGMSINNLSDMFIWAGNRGYIVKTDGSRISIDFWGKSMNDNNWVVGREYIYNGDTGETIHKGAWYHFKSINNDNIAVGYYPCYPGPQKAFKYEGDVMTFLDSLGGHSAAMDINNKGQIVGSSSEIGGTYACLWENDEISKLPELEDSRHWSRTYSINELGEIVGMARCSTGYNAVLYKGSGVINLNTFIRENSEWRLLEHAVGINNEGYIIGYGYIYDNPHRQAFLMTPILKYPIDIKPGTCPNPLNVRSQGLLPVAILGLEDLDVDTIDIASIRLEGVAPVRSSYEDVATPADGNECECTTAGPDGYIDLSLKYRTPEIVEELVNAHGNLADGEMLTLTLTGVLSNGTPIEGTDCIRVLGKVPESIAAKKSDVNEDGIVDMLDFDIIAKYWLERTTWYEQ
ncbi:MAG: hypothetical protein ACYST6_11060 [Planctomycetota bacterium]|jgi:probable HAF family extracellular repeat protein